jgi:uracil-DNA glycosylase
MTSFPFIPQIGYTNEKLYRCNHSKYLPIDVGASMHPTWIQFFKEHNYSINEILRYLYVSAYEQGLEIRPLAKDVMNVFSMDPSAIKVVIVGQDPYPSEGVANGYAFATSTPNITSSLETIFRAIRGVEHPQNDYTLSGWIRQGVFLLNKTPVVWVLPKDYYNERVDLTVPESIWRDITKNVCLFINSVNSNVPFLLFGTKSSILKQSLPTRNCIVAPHPSGRNTGPNQLNDEPFTETSSIINWRNA